MPAPQILPKYSPAFKRKSLSVYSTTSPSPNTSPTISPIKTTAPLTTDAPKSLESLCSPTRSDCSFDFVSSNGSPENLRTKPRYTPKKTRADYDDSDNDSAVSSSQSSISRGFSPPTSPVPSDRSYASLEAAYQRRNFLLNNNNLTKSYLSSANNKADFTLKLNDAYIDTGEKSPTINLHQTFDKIPATRATQIPQRQPVKRSSSTDTNCSSSSTLTGASQACTDSLSKRILKPNTVEAINRKNILASAKCRSGRDLNGSPLIQRKFASEEALNSNKVGDKFSEKKNEMCKLMFGPFRQRTTAITRRAARRRRARWRRRSRCWTDSTAASNSAA